MLLKHIKPSISEMPDIEVEAVIRLRRQKRRDYIPPPSKQSSKSKQPKIPLTQEQKQFNALLKADPAKILEMIKKKKEKGNL